MVIVFIFDCGVINFCIIVIDDIGKILSVYYLFNNI